MRPLVLALALAAAFALAACRRPPGPAEAYRAFAAAVQEGHAEAVWALLSRRSREALDARARALAEAAPPGTVAVTGRDLVVGDAAFRAPRLASAIVLRESGDAAVVAVELEGGAREEVQLVREDGGWRVVVPGLPGEPPRGGQGR